MSLAPSVGQTAWGRTIGGIVDDEGTRACAHPAGLCRPEAATRDLADAIHAFCALHGAAPTLVEEASTAKGADAVHDWLRDAAHALDRDRLWLAQLTAAIGPIPSTPRHAESQATIKAQRHALATLARSERTGCAPGAALALLLDWHAIRDVLVAAAHRSGVEVIPETLPARPAIIEAEAVISAHPAHGRAALFGAQQLILQHRGLWHLLAARAEARDAL